MRSHDLHTLSVIRNNETPATITYNRHEWTLAMLQFGLLGIRLGDHADDNGSLLDEGTINHASPL